MANIFTKRGTDAKESINKGDVDLKKIYIRLKEDESVRVRVLSVTDYVEYLSVGDFNLGIYSQPSRLPLGEADAFEEAKNIADDLAGDDEDHELFPFQRLYAKKRYLFAFADIDSGEIRIWDATKNQAKKIIKQIEEYAEDLNEFAFRLTRTGTGTSTDYSLNLIPRLKPEEKEKFESFDDTVVEDEIFNSVLIVRSYEQQVEALKNAGFPVDEHFDVEPSEGSEGEAGNEDPTKGF